jgi:hypothetical protein
MKRIKRPIIINSSLPFTDATVESTAFEESRMYLNLLLYILLTQVYRFQFGTTTKRMKNKFKGDSSSSPIDDGRPSGVPIFVGVSSTSSAGNKPRSQQFRNSARTRPPTISKWHRRQQQHQYQPKSPSAAAALPGNYFHGSNKLHAPVDHQSRGFKNQRGNRQQHEPIIISRDNELIAYSHGNYLLTTSNNKLHDDEYGGNNGNKFIADYAASGSPSTNHDQFQLVRITLCSIYTRC